MNGLRNCFVFGCILAAVGCSTENRAEDVDPAICEPSDEGLTADTVAATGYDLKYSSPSETALLRDRKCTRPVEIRNLRSCEQEWLAAKDHEQARSLLLWQSWCWHGVDLAQVGSVSCNPEAEVGGVSQTGSFRCSVEYKGQVVDRFVLRGSHEQGQVRYF